MPAFPDRLGGLSRGDDWSIVDHLAFTFELPLAQVEALLPAQVSPVRPAPGLGLVQLIHARYPAGTLGEPEPFDEVVCAALVEPDLSLDMPLPKVTLHVVDVLSNSARFVAHKVPALKMPVHHAPSLRGAFDADGLGSKVEDERGPLLELRCPDASRFKPKSFCGQYFALHEGTLHHSVWAWQGSLFESQRARRDTGVVHAHPWLAGLGLEALTRAPCFMRQLREPGQPVSMRTYAARRFVSERAASGYDGASAPSP
ncbi:MAG: hypothetical protein KC731_06045 [Myxococcales bacterium]|nr:hypothetical protein [Myxococcales bacterium]